MLLFRLLTMGVCVACVVMLATMCPLRLEDAAPEVMCPSGSPAPASAAVVLRDRTPGLSVVDVGAGVAPSALLRMIGLRQGEQVRSINDQALDEDLDADLLIRSFARPGGFLDLTVAAATTERRVLVLLH